MAPPRRRRVMPPPKGSRAAARMFKTQLAMLLQRSLDVAEGLAAAVLRRRRRLPPGMPVRMTPTQLAWDAYLHRRDGRRPRDLSALHAFAVPGLVSIVLPVYNGERHLAEALESILAQTYQAFELIVVDDGSSDATPEIIARYAAAEARLRPLRQANAGLPGALNAGFAAARGELLTWTSDDNRLHPDFLEKMVAALRAEPGADLVYADYDLIGEDGALLAGSPVCARLQHPPGSGHVRLLRDLSILNLINGNYIGGAFLYRSRVRHLIGDYSPRRFTCEDYDFFLRVNEQLHLCHVPFDGSVYDYRIHGGSLSARKEELQIDRKTEALLAFDGFRRDLASHPIAWTIETSAECGGRNAEKIKEKIEERIRARGDLLWERGTWAVERLPRFGLPAVGVWITDRIGAGERHDFPPGALRVLLYVGSEPLPAGAGAGWDLCLAFSPAFHIPSGVHGTPAPLGCQDWLATDDFEALWAAVLVRAQSAYAARVEAAAAEPAALAASIVIVHEGPVPAIEVAVRAACRQTIAPERYEVIAVASGPEAGGLDALIARIGAEVFPDDPGRLRGVLSPLAGESIARNAGLAEARGEIVVFLDGGTIAEPDLLERFLNVYALHPECAAIGGSVLLQEPVAGARPAWFASEARPYWGHFEPVGGYNLVEDWRQFPRGENWSARRAALLEIGGFRCRYGRGGRQWPAGAEVVAALALARLGYAIGIEPAARVTLQVDPSRFTLAHLARTIREREALSLALELDFYIERPAHWPRLLRQAAHCLCDGFFTFRKNNFVRIEGLLTGLAQARLAGMQLALAARSWKKIADCGLRIKNTIE